MFKKLLFLLMVVCVALVFSQVGCSEDEDENPLKGVWRVTEVNYGDGPITFPAEVISSYGGGTMVWYYKFTEDTYNMYLNVQNNSYTGMNGISECPTYYSGKYSVSDDKIIWDDNDYTPFSQSGSNLKITFSGGDYETYLKVSEDEIANSVVNCIPFYQFL